MAAIKEFTRGLDAVTELWCLLDEQSSPLKELCDQIIASIETGISLLNTPGPAQRYSPTRMKRPLRKKKMNDNKVTITDSPFSGGYRWSKYAQKTIGNFTYLRCYYRCNSGKCKGKIQVRKLNSKVFPEYEVITTSEHTCHIVQHNPLLPPTNVEVLESSRFERTPGNDAFSSPKPTTDQPLKSADFDFSWDEQAWMEFMSFID